MIDPSECFVATISKAKSLTLVLPRTAYDHRCLIVTIGEKPISICLDEVQQLGRFLAFECGDDENWEGVHFPDVRIELDETSIHDAEGFRLPIGSMIRSDSKLECRVWFEQNYQRHGSVVILDDLPACDPNKSACFLKWQIVLGDGEGKRVLAKVDATPVVN